MERGWSQSIPLARMMLSISQRCSTKRRACGARNSLPAASFMTAPRTLSLCALAAFAAMAPAATVADCRKWRRSMSCLPRARCPPLLGVQDQLLDAPVEQFGDIDLILRRAGDLCRRTAQLAHPEADPAPRAAAG